jgi:hypothetical protein
MKGKTDAKKRNERKNQSAPRRDSFYEERAYGKQPVFWWFFLPKAFKRQEKPLCAWKTLKGHFFKLKTKSPDRAHGL